MANGVACSDELAVGGRHPHRLAARALRCSGEAGGNCRVAGKPADRDHARWQPPFRGAEVARPWISGSGPAIRLLVLAALSDRARLGRGRTGRPQRPAAAHRPSTFETVSGARGRAGFRRGVASRLCGELATAARRGTLLPQPSASLTCAACRRSSPCRTTHRRPWTVPRAARTASCCRWAHQREKWRRGAVDATPRLPGPSS